MPFTTPNVWNNCCVTACNAPINMDWLSTRLVHPTPAGLNFSGSDYTV